MNSLGAGRSRSLGTEPRGEENGGLGARAAAGDGGRQHSPGPRRAGADQLRRLWRRPARRDRARRCRPHGPPGQPLRLDRALRARRGAAAPGPGAVRPARSRRGGRPQGASAAEARDLRRLAIPGAAHGPAATGPRRVRRDAYLRRPGLSGDGAARRLEGTPLLLEHGESFVLYALMDFVVDNYFPIIDEIETEVERIEDTVFRESNAQIDVQRIYELRRDLLTLRRAMAPLCEVCTRLTRPGMPVIEPDMHHYFRDVHDHVLRIDESIDMLRELLTSVFESSVMLSSTRQNEVTKMLAAWAAILAVPTAI